MSAASPTSSEMAVDSVSGEIATPAFIFRSWMEWIKESGSAEDGEDVSDEQEQLGRNSLTSCLEMKAVEGAPCICDVVYPLRGWR